MIYGLPQQDESQWLEDLDRAIQINPEHLSCYILTRESGTALDSQVAAGHINLPAEDHLRRLFEVTSDPSSLKWDRRSLMNCPDP